MGLLKDAGQQLDFYQKFVHKIILKYQDPVTGLFPASEDNDHAWIRDNVYTVLAVWGLSLAYKKVADIDDDRAKTYELEQSCVKLMRGLLMCMMHQKDKVEKFKVTQNPLDALHAKYSAKSGQTVVGDHEWGHLQIDAVSLYLLILAQMTASGLQIIFSLDEVAFIQNLVFYIESAYCIPDYGIWERGDKSNHGLPELNASSIGMAKAALEAINELDLFGARGGPSSVIHVLSDEAQKCQAVLQSMLPRESSSKELDSGLLSVISFPAFSVDDPNLIDLTRNAILSKLEGKYGCKRFLRDGHKTPKEDPNRLHYDPFELRMFERIESEWPLFFCYLILDYCFQGNMEAVDHYMQKLEKVTVEGEDGIKLVPELYAVPADRVDEEFQNPGSQERIIVGRRPYMWAQSLYILGKLLLDGFVAVGELDPLNRRLCSEKKPDVVVQVVILAEDNEIREKLQQYDIHIQTIADVAPIEVQPARVLSQLYTYLGRNAKLGLSGRKSRHVGILSTSKLYSLQDKIFAFTPQSMDRNQYYIASDNNLLLDIFKTEINFLKSSWQHMLGRPVVVVGIRHFHLDLDQYYTGNDVALLADNIMMDLSFLTMNWKHMLGRPLYTIIASSNIIEQGKIPLAMITTIKKLKSGYINGTRNHLAQTEAILFHKYSRPLCATNRLDSRTLYNRLMFIYGHWVTLGNLNDFLSTSCITNLSFLGSQEDGSPDKLNAQVEQYLAEYVTKPLRPPCSLLAPSGPKSTKLLQRRMSVKGAIKKTRSIITADGPFTEGTRPVRTPSPEDWPQCSSSPKIKINIDTNYAKSEVEELLTMLRESEHIEEQGDILQYLIDTKGQNYDTGMVEQGKSITVKDLLKVLYEKACQQKLWGLVRHTAGILGKRVEDLAKAVTDLLVRQKQVTVGMPPHNEHTITAPLPENELRQVIHEAYGDDESTAMLTQELLVYLAMFIRTEPHLFLEMLRLRIGLIIQVMAMELSRTLICSPEEASEHLLNLSPFEMKNLLYLIMSGKEFVISSGRGNFSVISCKSSHVSKKSQIGSLLSAVREDTTRECEADKQGQWLRRRRLDGALNRVPRDFYSRVWAVLEKCGGLAIEGRLLSHNLTQEMTPNELKFALALESVLNCIPQPEYRQLIVEALMVLTLITEHSNIDYLGDVITVEHLVHSANRVFLQDQMEINGDATLCCAKSEHERELSAADGGLICGGAAYICQLFYDSAPSGSFGTMTYLMRGIASLLNVQPANDQVDCIVS